MCIKTIIQLSFDMNGAIDTNSYNLKITGGRILMNKYAFVKSSSIKNFDSPMFEISLETDDLEFLKELDRELDNIIHDYVKLKYKKLQNKDTLEQKA